MRPLARVVVIVAAALLVCAAAWAVMQGNGAREWLPAQRQGIRPEFSANLGEGQRPLASERGEFRGGPEGERGGGLFGFSALIKNFVIFNVIFAIVVTLSILITRLRQALRLRRTEEQSQ